MCAYKNFIEFGNIVDITLPEEIHPFSSTGIIKTPDSISVYIYKPAYEGMKQHILQDSRNERGGILVGYPFINLQDKNRKFVYIKGHIPTESNNFSVGHFNVSPEELSRARNEMEEKFPGLIAVGWYHSHPGHGVFLSSQDMQIVRSIYNADWQLAFVNDPLQKKDAFFYGSKGVRIKNFEAVNNIPACILAIEKYNQAQTEQQAGDQNSLDKFRDWFAKNMIKELPHWFELGRYQDLELNNKNRNASSVSNTINKTSTHEEDSNQGIELLLKDAEQFVTINDFESLFPVIQKIHQRTLDEKNADRMKNIMRTIQARLAESNRKQRK